METLVIVLLGIIIMLLIQWINILLQRLKNAEKMRLELNRELRKRGYISTYDYEFHKLRLEECENSK